MRRILPCILTLLLLGVIASQTLSPADDTCLTKKFRKAMIHVDYKTYIDPDFDYSFDYPSFFSREIFPEYGVGHVRFGYHTLTDLVMECKVVPESVYRKPRPDCVELEYLDDSRKYQVITLYLLRDRKWFVLSFCYPTEFATAVERIVYRVKTWQGQGSGERHPTLRRAPAYHKR